MKTFSYFKAFVFVMVILALVVPSRGVGALAYADVISWKVENGILTIIGELPEPCFTIVVKKTRVIRDRFDVRVYAKPQRVELCAQVIAPFTVMLNVPPKKTVWVNGSPYPPYSKFRR
ncbi:MAG: hypothetical protein HY865_09655 [Chloroflexi bacterium]|nr:hypothetical protein [Chloroflexota bacterium]